MLDNIIRNMRKDESFELSRDNKNMINVRFYLFTVY
jgi:hypothetical protein